MDDFLVDSESRVEVSSWGVIAVLISWLECEKEGSTVVRTPLLVNGKVKGGCGWTTFLKKDQARDTEVEKDREAQKEAHDERFSSRITRLHWASRAAAHFQDHQGTQKEQEGEEVTR
ncbi:hypothetical protein E2C01_059241 [Portunus trituberculatus]|uniref:Uncharacterized protein n=1 Tax=Portunus trituberculatus TaxID=210409 RepID=A0A5B7H4T8_PORTR|nr:hypothetical protein [Portunus trituberculatus]